MQAIFGDRIGEIWIPGPWSAKEILGGFRLAAFVHHHKSRHRAEMRDQGNIHPAAHMHLGRFQAMSCGALTPFLRDRR